MKALSIRSMGGILALGLALGGCSSGSSNTASPEAGESKQDSKQESKSPIELVFYSTSGGLDEKGFMDTYGNMIKQKFPHITPVFIPYGNGTRMEDLITSGTKIDILYNSIGQTAQTLLQYRLQHDISDLIKKYNYNWSALEPSTVAIQRQIADGGLYGLPVNTFTMAMYYNKDIFDRFGVPYPKESMSWEQLAELTRKMTRTYDDQKYMGLGLSNNHFLLLTPYSAPYVDPKTNTALLTSEPFVKSFTAMTSLFTQGNELTNQTKSYSKLLEAWEKNQTVAMFLALTSLGERFTQAGLNWDYAPFPYFSDKKGVGPQNYPNYFYITNTSAFKDDAFQVIAYLTSEESQKALARKGLFPIVTSSSVLNEYGKDAPFLVGKNVQASIPATFAEPAVKTLYQALVTTQVTKAFEEVTVNKKDINTALREANEAADKAIRDEMAK